MASPKFYLLTREPQGGFAGSYVIINRMTNSPIGQGPWPLNPAGKKLARRCLDNLNERPEESMGQALHHINGLVSYVSHYPGPDGRTLWKLSGQAVDGRRLSSKDWISRAAAVQEACTERTRGGSGRVLAASGSGPKAKNKRSLDELERRRRIAREY